MPTRPEALPLKEGLAKGAGGGEPVRGCTRLIRSAVRYCRDQASLQDGAYRYQVPDGSWVDYNYNLRLLTDKMGKFLGAAEGSLCLFWTSA